MVGSGSIVETGVDKLVKLIKESGKISASEAAKVLNININLVMEWSDFLEEEGIISVEYNFTRPYLVDNKLTKSEADKKFREFEKNRDVFLKKAEITVGLLEKQSSELKSIKREFDSLKKQFGLEFDAVKVDLKKLENFEYKKESINQKLAEEKTQNKKKIDEVIQKISLEEKKINGLLKSIKDQEKEVEVEENKAKIIQKSESEILDKLDSVKELVASLEEKIKSEDTSLKGTAQKITNLQKMLLEMEQHVESEKKSLAPLLERSKHHDEKVSALHEDIIKTIQIGKKTGDSKKAAQKLKSLFKKKLAVFELVDKINKDRDSLESDFIDLIKKAKSFQLTSDSVKTSKEISELQKKFKDVENKKKSFESEIRKFKLLSK